MTISGPKLCKKLEFQFGGSKFPLNCLRKTQISLRIFESPLPRHAGCYYPIFDVDIRGLGARAVRSDRNKIVQLSHTNMKFSHFVELITVNKPEDEFYLEISHIFSHSNLVLL